MHSMRQERPEPHTTASRPIAAMRARNYALQAQTPPASASGTMTQRGLRRNRSNEASRSPVRQEAVAAGSMRRMPQRIGVSGRQQSEPAGGLSQQPPTRRLRTTPSASDLRTQATPLARQHRAVPAGGSLGRTARVISPGTTRPTQRRPLPSPHVATNAESSRQVTHIPRPAPPVDETSRHGISHTFMFNEYQERTRQLNLERQTNSQLIADLKSMNACVQALELDLSDTRAHAADAQARAEEAERERDRVYAVNKALEDKVAALMELAKVQAGKTLRSNNSSNSEIDDAQNPSDRYARMVSKIGAIRGACNTEGSRASAEGMRTVDEFLVTASNHKRLESTQSSTTTSPMPFTPRQRRQASHDARVDRRRSTMLFAGLIRPSGSASSPMGEAVQSQCQRCDQLLESLQTIQIDNDYYREANSKLRDNVSDVVSRHNAMVRAFECERKRRRDRRAHDLAEASHLAARDRALFNAQQRVELGLTDSDELAQRFDRVVQIS
ncbi:hypothetical protein IWW50_006195 [Coemansia erecta]|nr:hypothetical protein GGF43_005738 [Coemansia sp. RSA 2618]KAJ2817358.1 hypothetical protein IWW50_006195 [Coemansia erecta]